MPESSAPYVQPYDALNDDLIVYIALRDETFKNPDTEEIEPKAFDLRERDLHDGLSLIVCDAVLRIADIPELVPRLTKRVAGIDAIRVGDIRELGEKMNRALDVVQTSKHHACLKGLPYRHSGNPADAKIATTLGERLVLLCKRIDR